LKKFLTVERNSEFRINISCVPDLTEIYKDYFRFKQHFNSKFISILQRNLSFRANDQIPIRAYLEMMLFSDISRKVMSCHSKVTYRIANSLTNLELKRSRFQLTDRNAVDDLTSDRIAIHLTLSLSSLLCCYCTIALLTSGWIDIRMWSISGPPLHH
jgi:hypothetical protein